MRARILSGMFILCIVSATFRGYFEHLGSKQLGYAVQLACAMAFVASLFMFSRRTPVADYKLNAITIYGLFLVSALSGTYVSITHGFYDSWIYVAVMSCYYLIFFVFASYRFEDIARVSFISGFSVLTVALIAVATLQQQFLLLDFFPGSDMASMAGRIRPSSMTGSFLHYPLAIAILCFILLQAYAVTHRRALLALSVAAGVAVISSFSRSGAMILIFSLCAYLLIGRNLAARVRFFLLAFLGLPVILLLGRDNTYVDRILSATEAGGAGNSGRLHQWGVAFRMWSDSPLLIGNYTGMVTNVTKNLSDQGSMVVESGALQQLLSFGLVGAILFYCMFAINYRNISRDHLWLRAMVIGAALQSFIYQSVEVFPFMVLVSMAPLYSHHLTLRRALQASEISPGLAARPFGRT